jgi:hypothetical protein
VNNYYSVSDDAIQVIAARAYVAGNVSGDRADLNRVGTEQVPFPAPFVDTTDACAAAADVLQRAGTRPLDDLDRLSLARVPVNGCAAGSTPTPDVTGPSDPAAVTGVWAVAAAADDGLETVSGSVKVVSVVIPVGRASLTAFRFAGIDIPRGAVIQSAVLYLFTLGNDGKAIHVRYRGERSADSAPLSLAAGDLSSRSKTTAFIDGSPPPWPLREFSASPDLSTVIHEIVAQPGWQPGNSLTLFVADNGSAASRSVGAFESRPSPTRAAQLVVTYR